MKRAYYYLFYKLYKLWEYISTPKFWSDWKAGVSIIALEIWLLMSIGVYYSVITKRGTTLSIKMPIAYIPLIIIIALNYFAFLRTDKWKDYVREFDELPESKNRIGSWIVFGIVVIIIANLVFSFYLMSQIDWKKYQ